MKRLVSGVLLLDKPVGITSQTAVAQAKRLYGALKAGHTGTLDPMASGLLPVCLGEATKFSHLLLDADKAYEASIRLGVTTSTGDAEGEVTARAPVAVDGATLAAVLRRFTGEILQTPPMYSAIKHAGKPLYKYARAGVELERLARRVHIHAIELQSFAHDELRIALRCSKGTYVRVLAEDIGRVLGCGACLSGLRRTAVGRFVVGDAIGLEALQELAPGVRDAVLLPVDSLVATLPRVDLAADQARRIATGLFLPAVDSPLSGLVRIYGPGDEYLGVAVVEAPGGRVVPRRLMSPKNFA